MKFVSGRDFAKGQLLRFGAFGAITLAFPFLVYFTVRAMNPGGEAGSSALAMVLSLYLKPVIFFIFALSTIRLSIQRARSIGISWFIGLCVTLLVVCDVTFGVSFGSFWAASFSMGILSVPVPASLAAAVVVVVTLSFINFERPMKARLKLIYAIWKVLLFVFVVVGLLGLLQGISHLIYGLESIVFWLKLQVAMGYSHDNLIYPHTLLIAFAAASIALIWEDRRSGPAKRDRPQPMPERKEPVRPVFGRKHRFS